VIEMKTLRTIAAILVAVALVFGPTIAFAAGEAVTISTNASSYSGQATIQVTGTVTPPPSVTNTAVVVTTKGSSGVVDTGTAIVATGSGDYTYVFVAGSPMWVTGTYTVNATYGGPGGTGSATTTFGYQAAGQGGVVTVTTTTTVTTAVSTATVTTTVPSSDAAALSSIQSSLSVLTTGFSSMNTAIQSLTTTVNSIQSAVNTVSTAVTGLTSQLTAISGNISTVNGIGNQLTSLNNAVNNNQTYVLVVAALAAITLVLELAILVRKLS
jgi:hypothetical protein